MWILIFVLDKFWTCDLSIYLYIFLTHVDALLWFYYESFYDVVECKCLCDVLLHCVCIFRHDYALCCGCMFPIYCYGCANLEYR